VSRGRRNAPLIGGPWGACWPVSSSILGISLGSKREGAQEELVVVWSKFAGRMYGIP
jgi:hypothetical protein